MFSSIFLHFSYCTLILFNIFTFIFSRVRHLGRVTQITNGNPFVKSRSLLLRQSRMARSWGQGDVAGAATDSPGTGERCVLKTSHIYSKVVSIRVIRGDLLLKSGLPSARLSSTSSLWTWALPLTVPVRSWPHPNTGARCPLSSSLTRGRNPDAGSDSDTSFPASPSPLPHLAEHHLPSQPSAVS